MITLAQTHLAYITCVLDKDGLAALSEERSIEVPFIHL